jgi:hypothetical protein
VARSPVFHDRSRRRRGLSQSHGVYAVNGGSATRQLQLALWPPDRTFNGRRRPGGTREPQYQYILLSTGHRKILAGFRVTGGGLLLGAASASPADVNRLLLAAERAAACWLGDTTFVAVRQESPRFRGGLQPRCPSASLFVPVTDPAFSLIEAAIPLPSLCVEDSQVVTAGPLPG